MQIFRYANICKVGLLPKFFGKKICESVKKAYEYGAICLFYTLFSYLCSA